MSVVKNINNDNFDTEVVKSDLPVMMDFWAPWCGPCRMVGPVVENLANENSAKINTGKINVDENQALAMQFGVRSIPTIVFFKNGQEVKRIVGAQGKAQLQKVINEITA